MKTFLINLCSLITIVSYSQNKEVKNFIFNNIQIEYTRIDYSKYGTGLLFISMYNESLENNQIETKSINCLKKIDRLYHTLYFYLKIPTDIKGQTQKNEMFSKFIAHLKEDEKLNSFYLYLNFDYDYSILYKLSNNNIKRITTNISSKNICQNLTAL